MTALEIRLADRTDACELAAVYRIAYRVNRELGFPMKAESVTENEVGKWIRKNTVTVAVADGEIVGGVRVEETDSYRAKISRLAVHEQQQRNGIGSRLLDYAESVARERGYTTIWLTTPKDHPHLPAYYRERGYEKTGLYPVDYRPYDEITMEKESTEEYA
jgi:ribosomal protein S18 acetylase RimI-like enzyme